MTTVTETRVSWPNKTWWYPIIGAALMVVTLSVSYSERPRMADLHQSSDALHRNYVGSVERGGPHTLALGVVSATLLRHNRKWSDDNDPGE
jgi:hypothetical protein